MYIYYNIYTLEEVYHNTHIRHINNYGHLNSKAQIIGIFDVNLKDV